jgi:hypothetical protein
LRIQLEEQFRQFQAEQQAREAAAAASTAQHQETLNANKQMNDDRQTLVVYGNTR